MCVWGGGHIFLSGWHPQQLCSTVAWLHYPQQGIVRCGGVLSIKQSLGALTPIRPQQQQMVCTPWGASDTFSGTQHMQACVMARAPYTAAVV